MEPKDSRLVFCAGPPFAGAEYLSADADEDKAEQPALTIPSCPWHPRCKSKTPNAARWLLQPGSPFAPPSIKKRSAGPSLGGHTVTPTGPCDCQAEESTVAIEQLPVAGPCSRDSAGFDASGGGKRARVQRKGLPQPQAVIRWSSSKDLTPPPPYALCSITRYTVGRLTPVALAIFALATPSPCRRTIAATCSFVTLSNRPALLPPHALPCDLAFA